MTRLPEEAIERATKQYAWSGRMSDALKAAYPAIEKQIRAEIAAEIREAINGLIKISREIRPGLYERDIRYEGLKDAYTHAARIAEGNHDDAPYPAHTNTRTG